MSGFLPPHAIDHLAKQGGASGKVRLKALEAGNFCGITIKVKAVIPDIGFRLIR